MRVLLDRATATEADWLALKNGRIGSSQISTVMGMNPFQTRLELWAQMTGKAPGVQDNDAMWLGRQMEPVIGKLFERRTGLVARPADMLLQHETLDWAVASPDFFVKVGEKDYILEAKNTSSRGAVYWENGAPASFLVQLNWQLGISELVAGWVAGLIGGCTDDYRHDEMEFNKPLFDMCAEEGERFIELVKSDIPPEPSSGDFKLLLKLQGGREARIADLEFNAVPAANNLEKWTAEQKRLNAELKKVKAELDLAKAQLLAKMGNAQQAILPDGRRIFTSLVNQPAKVIDAFSYTTMRLK